MNPLLLALSLLVLALLGAQLTFARRELPLGPRLFVATGGPFVLVGFVLGPHLTGLLARDVIDQLTPLLALGLGWIGVLIGLQLDREHLRRFPGRYLAITWLQAAAAFGIALGVGHMVIGTWSELPLGAILLAGAATACVSTPTAIALISNTYRAQGRISRLLFFAASLDGVVGIIALALTYAAHHTGMFARGVALSLFEWFLISTLLGVFFGILFLSLTRVRPRMQESVLLIIGLVFFAAGTAVYLSLSPLYVCMITGIVIGNLSPLRRRAYAILSDWEKPIYIIVLVLAGALLQFASWWIIPLVAVYLAGRLLAKAAGGLLAAPLAPPGLDLPRRFGLALMPQGGLSLAMAISFAIIYDPQVPGVAAAAETFFATVVLAVGVSDLMGPFLVRAVLQRAGELDQVAPPEPEPVGTARGG